MLRNGYRTFENPQDVPGLSVFEHLMSLPEMVRYGLDVDVGDYGRSKRICIFGIGQSSIAGDVISAYADYFSDIPVVNVTNGILPGWVGDDTDVIIVSYTGKNTIINEIYDSLKDKNNTLTCITSGGRLAEKCQNDGKRVVNLPEGLSSRTALGIEIGVLVSIVQRMGLTEIRERLVDILPTIKGYRDSLFDDLRIETLIPKLKGNTIAFYGSPDFRASFRRWKMSFNEDLGSLAFCGELPEYNHNEIVGWANHNQNDDDLKIAFLRGKYKNDVLTKIIDKTIEVLEESGRHVMDLKILGEEPMEKNLRAIMLGDFVSQIIGNGGKLPARGGINE